MSESGAQRSLVARTPRDRAIKLSRGSGEAEWESCNEGLAFFRGLRVALPVSLAFWVLIYLAIRAAQS